MSCQYENIYDLCANKYIYEYFSVTSSSSAFFATSGTVASGNSIPTIANTGSDATVVRIDKDTGDREIITSFTSMIVDHCDNTVESQSVNAWTCYQIYRAAGGIIADPSLETFKNAQYQQLTDDYNNTLSNGISIPINNQTITLDASLDSQIYYKNIASTAQALYNTDVDSVMPKFTDKDNNLYSFNYDNINSIFQEYFTKVIYYKNLKDILTKKINDSNSINSVSSISWNTITPIENDPGSTFIINNKSINTPICSSKTDPDIKLCTNSSQCPSGYYCLNGICAPQPPLTTAPHIGVTWCGLEVNTLYGLGAAGFESSKSMYLWNRTETYSFELRQGPLPAKPIIPNGPYSYPALATTGDENFWTGYIRTMGVVPATYYEALVWTDHRYKIDQLGNMSIIESVDVVISDAGNSVASICPDTPKLFTPNPPPACSDTILYYMLTTSPNESNWTANPPGYFYTYNCNGTPVNKRFKPGYLETISCQPGCTQVITHNQTCDDPFDTWIQYGYCSG